MNEKTIARQDGARIHYRDHGDPGAGTMPIVFSNSLATDQALWTHLLAPLGRRHRLITYDTRGHGRSHAPTPRATLAELAADLIAVLDDAGVPRACVVGISLGGMTALQCALDWPDRVAGLVACHCRAGIDPAGIDGWNQRLQALREQGLEALVEPTLARWFAADFREARPDRIDETRAMIRRTSPVGYEACVRAIQGIALTDRLPAIRVPALVLAGAQDAAASPDTMRAMAEAIPGAVFEVLDPCGHLSAIQCPEVLVARISRFLSH